MKLNNSPRIMPCDAGVILPHTSRVLTKSDLEKKIENVKNQISHLNQQLPKRITHGGANFREKRITILSQLAAANERLEMYEKAKKMIPEKSTQEPTTKETSSYSSMIYSAFTAVTSPLATVASGVLAVSSRIFGR